MSAIAWSTIANLATALGTLILAVATFSAVRSSNLMARVAREQLLVQLRPVLTTSRREDPTLKVNFGDEKWVRVPGGGAVGEVSPGEGSMGPDTPVVYLAIALRNAGNGIAVLHGWHFYPDAHRDTEHAPLEEFQRQNRDLYIPVGDVGFWQGHSATPWEPVRRGAQGHRGSRVVDGGAALRRPRRRSAGGQPVHRVPGRELGPEPGRRAPPGAALAGHGQQALEHRPSRPEMTAQAPHRESSARSGDF